MKTAILFLAFICTLVFHSVAQDVDFGRKMESTNGEQLSINDAKLENGVIVIFSCNTCPFVVGREGGFAGWEKDYNNLAKMAKSQNIGIILVNSNEGKRPGEDDMAEMKAHAEKLGYRMPYVLDKNHVLADQLKAKTTPHVYMFDKDMNLVYTGAIDNTWDPKRTTDVHYLLDIIMNFPKVLHSSTEARGCSIKRIN